MTSARRLFGMLLGDRLATISAIFLIALILAVIFVPMFSSPTASLNLMMRNAPPALNHGIAYLLGGDTLGRAILPRLLEGGRGTLLVAVAVVILSGAVGALLGLLAGYYGRLVDSFVMRTSDVVMSFPSLLLAVIILYMFTPSITNVIIVLAITRTPVYIRVTRAETLEVRGRLFVEGARAAGATDLRILGVHIAPIIFPTIFTLASLDFANVMLAESSLSFLGIGVQPPAVTWGLMVANGRDYLTTAWWLAFWPGFAIVLTALAANLLSNWVRIAMDPKLSWRLQRPSWRKSAKPARKVAIEEKAS
ncbi:MAG TPA: ABC transporter permease [Devosiaceae bacterium]|jgi:peptide/nickel transport system permease protein